MNQRHSWTYEENLICTEEAIKQFVINQDMDYEDVISTLYIRLDLQIKKGSIKMKLSNIKYLFEKYKIKNTLMIAPLNNASEDNEMALRQLMRRYNINSSNSED